jgi:hypothetical protein
VLVRWKLIRTNVPLQLRNVGALKMRNAVRKVAIFSGQLVCFAWDGGCRTERAALGTFSGALTILTEVLEPRRVTHGV